MLCESAAARNGVSSGSLMSFLHSSSTDLYVSRGSMLTCSNTSAMSTSSSSGDSFALCRSSCLCRSISESVKSGVENVNDSLKRSVLVVPFTMSAAIILPVSMMRFMHRFRVVWRCRVLFYDLFLQHLSLSVYFSLRVFP